MKLLLSFIIGLSSISAGYSQSGFNITYIMKYEHPSVFIFGNTAKPPLGYSRLVFNDTVCFWYGMRNNKDPMKSNKVYGSKVYNHCYLYDRYQGIYYTGVANSHNIKEDCFVTDSLKGWQWLFSNNSKNILDYQCYKAYKINEYIKDSSGMKTWESDSTIVWYTEQLKMPFGPYEYLGLPGIVLEVYDQNRMGMHVLATKIGEDNFTIGISSGIPVYTEGEFKKRNQ